MPSYSCKIAGEGGLFRPIVPISVARAEHVPSPKESRKMAEAGEKTSIKLNFHQARGLLDTGATVSCITASLAEKIGARPLGKRKISTASERNVMRNMYRVALMVVAEVVNPPPLTPANGQDKAQRAISPKMMIHPISGPLFVDVGEFVNLGPTDVDALIGMDVISRSVMIVAGHDRRLTISF